LTATAGWADIAVSLQIAGESHGGRRAGRSTLTLRLRKKIAAAPASYKSLAINRIP